MRRAVAAGILAPIALLGAGCLSARIEMGRPVATERLERELRIGESTSSDVRRVLGPPDGEGGALLPVHDGPREVWSYYYEFSDVAGLGIERWGRMFLWVYLDEGVYDGYLWFSSVPEDRGEP